MIVKHLPLSFLFALLFWEESEKKKDKFLNMFNKLKIKYQGSVSGHFYIFGLMCQCFGQYKKKMKE